VRRFRTIVYAQYRTHGRSDLPWRKTADSYKIFVSEIMLQQTQVPRVLERFEAFIARFPDFASLAAAPLREVLREWSGLGYNRRALHLKRAAEMVVRDFGGVLPAEPNELVQLPGVGKATAGAVAAFAFGAAHPFIDRRDPRRWFSALMDYGASLKKRFPNPSRASARYVRQGRFEGSDRQARGLIVRALTERNLDAAALRIATGLDAARLRRNLARLIEEGMVSKRGNKYDIAR
jgi:A/G-specific adenine glycosylase